MAVYYLHESTVFNRGEYRLEVYTEYSKGLSIEPWGTLVTGKKLRKYYLRRAV